MDQRFAVASVLFGEVEIIVDPGKHCYLKTLISSKNKPSNTMNLNRRVNPEISNVNPHNAVRFQGFLKPSYHAVYCAMLRLCRIM